MSHTPWGSDVEELRITFQYWSSWQHWCGAGLKTLVVSRGQLLILTHYTVGPLIWTTPQKQMYSSSKEDQKNYSTIIYYQRMYPRQHLLLFSSLTVYHRMSGWISCACYPICFLVQYIYIHTLSSWNSYWFNRKCKFCVFQFVGHWHGLERCLERSVSP